MYRTHVCIFARKGHALLSSFAFEVKYSYSKYSQLYYNANILDPRRIVINAVQDIHVLIYRSPSDKHSEPNDSAAQFRHHQIMTSCIVYPDPLAIITKKKKKTIYNAIISAMTPNLAI